MTHSASWPFDPDEEAMLELTGRCAVFTARWASVAAKTVKTSRQVRMVSKPHALARLTPWFSLFAAPRAAV